MEQQEQISQQVTLSQQDSQPVSQPSQGVKYAGFWIRWVANFIDGLVLIIPNLVVGIIIKVAALGAFGSFLSSISGLLVSWIYFILMTNKYQATLGKKAVGIKVLSDKSENLTLFQVIIRETIGKLASMIILFIGYIMAGFTKRKQALHDKIASTLVIYKDPNKKVTVWVVVVVVIASFLMLAAIVGILASIVLVSLNNARGKAQDASLKATVSSIIPDAILYQDEKGSYLGYKLPADLKIIECSGEPIVNIANNGKEMAIFAKLCSDEKKYFCADVSGSEYIEVDEAYAKSGAIICNPSSAKESLNSEVADVSISTSNNGLNTDFTDDLDMIESAIDVAKKWQADAVVYGVVMIADGYLALGEHEVSFKSENNTREKFKVLFKEGNIVSSKSKQIQSSIDAGYIIIDSIKFSSSDAFQICNNLAIKNNLNLDDYDKDFGLSYFKSSSITGWRYILTNKKSQSFPPVPDFECIIDASSGKVIRNQ